MHRHCVYLKKKLKANTLSDNSAWWQCYESKSVTRKIHFSRICQIYKSIWSLQVDPEFVEPVPVSFPHRRSHQSRGSLVERSSIAPLISFVYITWKKMLIAPELSIWRVGILELAPQRSLSKGVVWLSKSIWGEIILHRRTIGLECRDLENISIDERNEILQSFSAKFFTKIFFGDWEQLSQEASTIDYLTSQAVYVHNVGAYIWNLSLQNYDHLIFKRLRWMVITSHVCTYVHPKDISSMKLQPLRG
jgi:hypothetical protein